MNTKRNTTQRSGFFTRILTAMPILLTLAIVSFTSRTANAQPIPDTPITDCGFVISTPGVYTVTQSLTSTSKTIDCIQVNSPGVRLVLDGRSISGPGGNDVSAAGVRILNNAIGVQVLAESATIQGFGIGISIEGSGVTIEGGFDGTMVQKNAAQGILVSNASNVLLDDVNSQENGAAGLELANASGVTVQGSPILQSNEGYGLWIHSSSGNQFFNLESFGNKLAGIFIGEANSQKQKQKLNTKTSDDTSENNVFVSSAVVQNGTNGLEIGAGNFHNVVTATYGQANTGKDAVDDNENCENNQWVGNRFITTNSDCIH